MATKRQCKYIFAQTKAGCKNLVIHLHDIVRSFAYARFDHTVHRRYGCISYCMYGDRDYCVDKDRGVCTPMCTCLDGDGQH